MSNINCICDANIWIDACHCDSEVDYLNIYSLVGFAEQVHHEIVKFQNNNDKFEYIYSKYIQNKHLYKVLKSSDLYEMEPQFLYELSLKGFTDIDNSSKNIKDLGEYASLYFAYYLKIPFIHTSDLKFIENEAEKMPGIEIITWSEVCEEISKDDDDRISKNRLIEQKKKEMNTKKEEKREKEKREKEKREKVSRRLEEMMRVTNAKRLG